jgi:hypothetical protein
MLAIFHDLRFRLRPNIWSNRFQTDLASGRFVITATSPDGVESVALQMVAVCESFINSCAEASTQASGSRSHSCHAFRL